MLGALLADIRAQRKDTEQEPTETQKMEIESIQKKSNRSKASKTSLVNNSENKNNIFLIENLSSFLCV